MKKFSDFNTDTVPLDGDKIKIDAVINEEIKVVGYNIRKSKYDKNNSGKCLGLQIEKDEEHRIIFTGSDVLINQIEKYNQHIPFLATIRKIDKYYTFT